MKLDQEHSEPHLAQKTSSVENVDDQLLYEAFYFYPINDGMTITPIVSFREVTSGDNETALMIKSSFSFLIHLINPNKIFHKRLRPLLRLSLFDE